MGTKRFKLIVATALAALVAGAAVAQASVGGFSAGDGREDAGNCTTMLDWSCLAPSQLNTALDPSSTGDVVFGGGEKQDQPDQWTFSPGSATAKADVLGAWSYSFTNPAHDTNYLALAFNRGGTGDAFLGFELNQSTTPTTNAAGASIVCPQTGDVLVSFEIPGSGPVTLHIYKWAWSSGSPCQTGSSGSYTDITSSLPAIDGAELAINSSSSITNTLSPATLGSSFAAATFGEAAVNLTAIADAVAPASGCEFFNHLQLTSRSSSSTSSQVQDFVDGGAIVAAACESPGGSGGGGCTSYPSVHVGSPADNSTDQTSSVTLTGTSDQLATATVHPEVKVTDGLTVVGLAPTDSAGNWSLTLTGVADGTHSYTASATNSSGCTGSSNLVHVVVNTSSSVAGGNGGAPGGNSSTSASSTRPGGSSGVAGVTGKHARKGALCSSKRKFIIRIRTHHAHLVSATITVNGKLVKTLHGKRITAPVDLRGLPRGGFTVRIRVRAADGRIFTGKRVYHTCTPRKSKRTIPLL